MIITTRKFHDVQQNTDKWLELRKHYITASNVPTIAKCNGLSRYLEAVKEKATGEEKELTSMEAYLFEKGHQFEEKARADLESKFGCCIVPAVVSCNVRGLDLLASLDGYIPDQGLIWECKTINNALRSCTLIAELPNKYKAQMTMQMLVSGVHKCFFSMANDDEIIHLGVYEFDQVYAEQLLDSVQHYLDEVLSYKSNHPNKDKIDRLLQEYFDLSQEISDKNDRLKMLRQHIDALMDGEAQYHSELGTVKRQERKGSIDYSAIPALKSIELEEYRKPPVSFYTIFKTR